ncbi:MAG: hypothetical protein RML94_09245 [Bacteroidia bacterium]|nr:hypothetical protein [Bacteroidia bacterium]
MIIKRRGGVQRQRYFETTDVERSQQLNQELRYVQSFRISISNGSNSYTVTLNSPGKMLLGVSLVPVNSSALNDTQVSLSLNNNNPLIGVAANNLNPSYVGNMIYFPVPQVLFGNDSFQFTFNKANAGSETIVLNIFYIPRT